MNDMTNSIDFAEVENLFTVVEKCVTHSGKYSSIMGLAMARLNEIEESAKVIRKDMVAAEAEAARPKAIPTEPEDDGDNADADDSTMTTTQRRL